MRDLGDLQRPDLLRRGVVLEAVTVAWNLVEGIVAVAAGTMAHSVALVAFGVDSFIETTTAFIVGWRLREEYRGRSPAGAEDIERRATRIAGALLLMLAAYIVFDAGARLVGLGEDARGSRLGIGLTALSLIVMPLLARAKLRVAARLGSRALRADAYETIACAWLSLTTLAGLGLNATLGWSWADPLAALLLFH
jgi:divalent metal cation (Fe/Co/Zn/Cd) transporter